MKGRKLHRGKVCPVWENGLGCETIFPSLSLTLCVPTSLLLLLQALQLSLPRHATPHSTTPPYISLLPSLHPSQEVLQHEWQAGAEGGIWGLLAKRQTGAAPLESLKWHTLKRVGRGQRKMKTSPRMSRPQISENFSPFCFSVSCIKKINKKKDFSSVSCPVRPFYKLCTIISGQLITFWYFCFFQSRMLEL